MMKKLVLILLVLSPWIEQSRVMAEEATRLESPTPPKPLEGVPPLSLHRWEAGIRYAYFSLIDGDRPADNSNNFLGSINKLEEVQNDVPYPFVNYMVCRYCGLSLSYDRLQAKTITKEDGHTDGTYDLEGPSVSILGRFYNSSRFVPYAEAGMVFYQGSFDHDPVWRHVGNDRLMVVEDTEGLLYTLGCTIELNHDWNLDVFCSYKNVEVDDKYYLNGNLREEHNIPLSNRSIGGGLKYVF